MPAPSKHPSRPASHQAEKPNAPSRRPEDAKSTKDVNEAANAEFHDDATEHKIGGNVGGLRGSPD